MSIIGWLVLGLIVGVLANWLVPGRSPGGVFGTVLGGAIGAFLGGALFALAFSRGIMGFDPGSLVIAFAGAAGLLTLIRLAGHDEPEPRFERRRRA